MNQRFVVIVYLQEDGDVDWAVACDNMSGDKFELPEMSECPAFVPERLALLKLTDVNKSEKGEIVGRKLDPKSIVIYISYDEYQELKPKRKSANEETNSKSRSTKRSLSKLRVDG